MAALIQYEEAEYFPSIFFDIEDLKEQMKKEDDGTLNFKSNILAVPLVKRFMDKPTVGLWLRQKPETARKKGFDTTYQEYELDESNIGLLGKEREADQYGNISVPLPQITITQKEETFTVKFRNLAKAEALIEALKNDIEDYYSNPEKYVRTI